jgi:hypothetical protein
MWTIDYPFGTRRTCGTAHRAFATFVRALGMQMESKIVERSGLGHMPIYTGNRCSPGTLFRPTTRFRVSYCAQFLLWASFDLDKLFKTRVAAWPQLCTMLLPKAKAYMLDGQLPGLWKCRWEYENKGYLDALKHMTDLKEEGALVCQCLERST